MSTSLLAGLNLNSLVALEALLSERNVTRAAQRVGITQPAMSQQLARLRELFDDPLLVRRGRGFRLTVRADSMREPLAAALESVERAVQLGLRFDPRTSRRIFRVAMTDLHLALTLPALLHALEAEASGVRLEAEPLSLRDPARRLDEGEIDLAIGFFLGAPNRIRKETLHENDYVCLVRRGHPLARRRRLRLGDYAPHHHLAHTPVEFVPREMSGSAYGFASREGIRASLPYLLALPSVVRATDLVATVPRLTLEAPVDFEGVVVLEAPRELPRVEHTIFWHERQDGDPAHAWLRRLATQAARAPTRSRRSRPVEGQ